MDWFVQNTLCLSCSLCTNTYDCGFVQSVQLLHAAVAVVVAAAAAVAVVEAVAAAVAVVVASVEKLQTETTAVNQIKSKTAVPVYCHALCRYLPDQCCLWNQGPLGLPNFLLPKPQLPGQ